MLTLNDPQKYLDRCRDEIVWRIISDGVLEGQRTLAVGVVAEEFFDRLMIALERSSYLDIVTWVDRICESYRGFPQIGSMLASACRSVIAQLGDAEVGADELVRGLGALEHSICAVAFKPRPLRVKSEAPLDEVDVLIRGLIDRLEAADPLSAEHSLAVSAWCRRIGRRLSLSETEVTYIARCGLMHDVGKVKVAGEILTAPRALTDSEWVVMRSHSLASEEIVGAHKALRSFAPAVRSHHERLDGRGYPDGLVGSQITLATRIVTVADAFNAMIGRRAYRLPISPENALDRLHENRGGQFDPIVVEAMASVVGHN
ncbi:MAG: HD domain-containing phosphohydrolase [Candidatus Velthaea sp.]|jgi:HD-GYP domain-containing protein (c-di-GMP phosphodiesterase class II)